MAIVLSDPGGTISTKEETFLLEIERGSLSMI